MRDGAAASTHENRTVRGPARRERRGPAKSGLPTTTTLGVAHHPHQTVDVIAVPIEHCPCAVCEAVEMADPGLYERRDPAFLGSGQPQQRPPGTGLFIQSSFSQAASAASRGPGTSPERRGHRMREASR